MSNALKNKVSNLIRVSNEKILIYTKDDKKVINSSDGPSVSNCKDFKIKK